MKGIKICVSTYGILHSALSRGTSVPTRTQCLQVIPHRPHICHNMPENTDDNKSTRKPKKGSLAMLVQGKSSLLSTGWFQERIRKLVYNVIHVAFIHNRALIDI
jgi:hypothetical protein